MIPLISVTCTVCISETQNKFKKNSAMKLKPDVVIPSASHEHLKASLRKRFQISACSLFGSYSTRKQLRNKVKPKEDILFNV